ncbi:hypothetical protein S2091_3833 [Solimicrobium silvestre]|uniref:Uncharacterized protein n=1 Tax=Solimicrobium silvestre TaxID=2099400 RepID=A0A2S9GUP3_9BURK|nr:hypothetical protein S2091_3833 [Solimicrobium silvestre]
MDFTFIDIPHRRNIDFDESTFIPFYCCYLFGISYSPIYNTIISISFVRWRTYNNLYITYCSSVKTELIPLLYQFKSI